MTLLFFLHVDKPIWKTGKKEAGISAFPDIDRISLQQPVHI